MKNMSNSNVQIFDNPKFGSIRMVEINGEPWWVGKDIAEALGYAKPENAIACHVDEEDKTSTLIQGSGSNYKSKSIIINESGMYSLILSSKLKKAKEFKHWVTSEVLPSIRKTGSYLAEGSQTQQYITQLQKAVTELSLKLIEINKALRVFSVKQPFDLKYVDNWKKYVAIPKVQTLSKNYGIDINDCYKMIYNTMIADYGFCESIVINDSLVNYEYNSISTINIIAIDKTYRQWFIQSVDKLLNGNTSIVTKLSLPVQHQDQLNKFLNVGISVNDDYDAIVEYIAGLMGDNTKLKIKTRKYIFQMITSARGWKTLLTRNRCATKKALIISNIKYKKKFVKVCNEIVNHCKYNK